MSNNYLKWLFLLQSVVLWIMLGYNLCDVIIYAQEGGKNTQRIYSRNVKPVIKNSIESRFQEKVSLKAPPPPYPKKIISWISMHLLYPIKRISKNSSQPYDLSSINHSSQFWSNWKCFINMSVSQDRKINID